MIKVGFKHLLTVAFAGFLAGQATGAELRAVSVKQPAPEQISSSIRALLSGQPVQLLDGDKPVMRLWLRREVALKSKPDSIATSLNALPETTLVGVISVQSPGFKDYKENDIPNGVFTARFALQPQDGDHLGTAEFNTFLVLIAAELDKETNSFTKFTPMVKASGKLTPSGHPLIVSLRPAASSEGNVPVLTQPVAEHKAIRLKLPGKSPAGDKADITFELVYEGRGHIQ
ncbi:MAG TPA: hypothetical protein VK633_03615 [Verrucomicrobiae bacterium]|nr:hypothetical protein [Verrucomicrobiae bacterium]